MADTTPGGGFDAGLDGPGSGDPERASIFLRAGQFFLVPLLIVLVCVGIYWFFSYLVAEQGTPAEWMATIRTGGQQSRLQAMHQLVVDLRRRHADKRPDPALHAPLWETYRSLPEDDPKPEDRNLRISLLGCMALQGDPRSVAPLVEVLERHPDAEVKAAAINALGALKAVEAAPVLIKFLDHESSVVRKYATFNLAAIAAPGKRGEQPAVPSAVDPVRRKLEDPRPEVQWNAATALAVFLHDPAGVNVLRKMLDRKHLEGVIGADDRAGDLAAHAMQQACQALAAVKDSGSLAALDGVAAGDPDPAVRNAARAAAVAIRKP